MNPSKKRYELHRRGRKFVVYRMEYTETGGMGSPVYQTNNFEDARKELYRLNGWKYQPKRNNES
jgi:hypothetical protein